MPPTLRPAQWPHDAPVVRELVEAYAEELDVDLSFQGFQAELAGLPGEYAPPHGNLWIAEDDGRAVGCVAIRPHGPGECEMKRLYVRPEARGAAVGRRLAEASLLGAVDLGYRSMVLDTLERLESAYHLYLSLGFQPIPAYYYNPLPGVIFFRRDLLPLQEPTQPADG